MHSTEYSGPAVSPVANSPRESSCSHSPRRSWLSLEKSFHHVVESQSESAPHLCHPLHHCTDPIHGDAVLFLSEATRMCRRCVSHAVECGRAEGFSRKRPTSTTLLRPSPWFVHAQHACVTQVLRWRRARSWSWRTLSGRIQRLPRVGTPTCRLQLVVSPAWRASFPPGLFSRFVQLGMRDVCIASRQMAWLPHCPVLCFKIIHQLVLPVLCSHRRCGWCSEFLSRWSQSRLGEPPGQLPDCSQGLQGRRTYQFHSSDVRFFVVVLRC